MVYHARLRTHAHCAAAIAAMYMFVGSASVGVQARCLRASWNAALLASIRAVGERSCRQAVAGYASQPWRIASCRQVGRGPQPRRAAMVSVH
jgi:hypothetical protein